MGDLKLFRISSNDVQELAAETSVVEKSLQTLCEKHLYGLLAIRFLATEYSTGQRHAGRIDTLGLDENGSPVIVEYKRRGDENVINQGLFYLDWLLDHRGEFELLVSKELGPDVAGTIEWTRPRLLCIAGEFTRYDQYAVEQIDRNIELLRYRTYEDDSLIAIELLNSVAASKQSSKISGSGTTSTETASSKNVKYGVFKDLFGQAGPELVDLYEATRDLCLSMGDDVIETELQNYVAFRRIKNFASLEVRPKANYLLAYLKLDPATVDLEEGFIRDVREIGHFGTGDVEISIRKIEDLESVAPLLERSYEDN